MERRRGYTPPREERPKSSLGDLLREVELDEEQESSPIVDSDGNFILPDNTENLPTLVMEDADPVEVGQVDVDENAETVSADVLEEETKQVDTI